jgi:biotin carboxylase
LPKRKNRLAKVLVTGAGGIGGVNFVRALRLAEKQNNVRMFVVCTDHNPYYLQFPKADARFVSPRHDSPTFVPTLLKLIKEYGVEFLHPHPSSEARVVSEKLALFKKNRVETYLPKTSSIVTDKLETYDTLRTHNVPVAKTIAIESLNDVHDAFSKIGHPLWIRARRGAGGRLGLKVETPEEAQNWVSLNAVQNRAAIGDFIMQEYLPGRDLAFDSLWFKGQLITSYGRERIEYALKHISLSGITGTPAIAKTIEDKKLNQTSLEAIKALDARPHGFFSVDVKEDARGKPIVTEVDGKWHTTAPLWGYALAKAYGKREFNLAYLYVTLGMKGNLDFDLPLFNLFPTNHYLVRQLDAGVILEHDEKTWKIA